MGYLPQDWYLKLGMRDPHVDFKKKRKEKKPQNLERNNFIIEQKIPLTALTSAQHFIKEQKKMDLHDIRMNNQ